MQVKCTSSFCHLFWIRVFLYLPSTVVVYIFFSFFDYLNVSFLAVFCLFMVFGYVLCIRAKLCLSFKTKKD